MIDRISPERARADKAMVNAIREMLGLAPLYGPNGDRKSDAERFAVDTAPASASWDRMHRSIESHTPQGLA